MERKATEYRWTKPVERTECEVCEDCESTCIDCEVLDDSEYEVGAVLDLLTLRWVAEDEWELETQFSLTEDDLAQLGRDLVAMFDKRAFTVPSFSSPYDFVDYFGSSGPATYPNVVVPTVTTDDGDPLK